MNVRDSRSIIIISLYVLLMSGIIVISVVQKPDPAVTPETAKSMAPEYTLIQDLEYFHLKDGLPLLSLVAESMRSQGEELAEFTSPLGIYNYQDAEQSLKYQASEAVYLKQRDLLTLSGEVQVNSDQGQYFADKLSYFLKDDLIIGDGNIRFEGDDLKTGDHVTVTSRQMRAHPQAQRGRFEGNVQGEILRKRAYEGKTTFSSNLLELERKDSLAHLEGQVTLRRGGHLLTAGKADIYLENFNNSLKYFVMNDDVKMREKFRNAEGVMLERRAFSERLEGFGREGRMVLSGAPRVEQGDDVIKGYRITIRENAELIEVDDAMSDVQLKQKKLKD